MMKSNLTVALITGVGIALAACSSKPATQNRAEVAGPTTIRDAVRLTGTIEPLDSVELKSEVSGRIVKVFFKEGDSVKRGQLILILDSVPLLLTRDKFALQVDRGNLALKIAVRELERAKEIFQTGTVTKDRLEDLETAVQRAELDVRDAKLSLRNAELDLARTRIRAPMDGRLINFPAEVGEVASSATGVNGGSALGTIADPTKLKVVVEVGELDFGRLRLGMPVKVSSEGGRPRPGKVSFIPSSARASNDTKTIKVFPVEVVLDGESEGILPGMTVGVDFVFLEREVAVSVPYEALKTGGKAAGKGVSGKTESGGQKTAMTDSVKAAPKASEGAAGRDSSGRRGGRKSGVSDATGAGSVAKSATVLVRGEKGEFVPKQVKIGVTDYRRTEIVEGLAVGDTVWVQDDAASKGAASKAGGPGGMR